MSNKKRSYSAQFKIKVVLEALREDKTISELSVKYNITPKNIHNWKSTFLNNAELAMEPSKAVSEYKDNEKQLRAKLDVYAKKVGELTLEKDFLEGKLVSLALSTRKSMIDVEHKLSMVRQCKLLQIDRSGYYYQPRLNTRKDIIKKRLIEVHNTYPCFGYIKAHRQLRQEGYHVCENTVQKYRKELEIKAVLAVKPPNLSKKNKQHTVYKYKLRDLNINRANQVWSTDITYIKTHAGTVYMAAIIDWYTKAVLSWDISNTMDSSLVMRVLNEAFYNYGTPEIFNTDQGSQYTSHLHTDALKDKGIIISMDGKGRATDNICIERFWRSAKCERIYLNEYRGIIDLKDDISDYIKFYNYDRFHESIDYKKPMELYNECSNIRKAA